MVLIVSANTKLITWKEITGETIWKTSHI